MAWPKACGACSPTCHRARPQGPTPNPSVGTKRRRANWRCSAASSPNMRARSDARSFGLRIGGRAGGLLEHAVTQAQLMWPVIQIHHLGGRRRIETHAFLSSEVNDANLRMRIVILDQYAGGQIHAPRPDVVVAFGQQLARQMVDINGEADRGPIGRERLGAGGQYLRL